MSSPLSIQAPPTEVIHALLTAYEEGLAAIRARETPVGLLYHYCDANALLSILRNRVVWASDTSYLNDTTELVSIFSGVRHHLEKPATVSEKFVYDILLSLSNTAENFRKNLIGLSSFVGCFSEDGDLLSQWRAYGSDGMGFAIGFDPTELRILAEGGGGTLKRMLYRNEAEKQIINEYYNKVVASLAPLEGEFTGIGFPSMDFPTWLGLRMSEFIHELAFESKHPAFFEEREWRIIAGKQKLAPIISST